MIFLSAKQTTFCRMIRNSALVAVKLKILVSFYFIKYIKEHIPTVPLKPVNFVMLQLKIVNPVHLLHLV